MPEGLHQEIEPQPTKKIVAKFRRHFDPKKDPKTMFSLDELSEKGVDQAKQIGQELLVPDSGIAGRHSPKERAKESVNLELEAAKELGRFNIRERKEFDTIDINSSPEAKTEYTRISQEQGFDAAVQYLLDTPLLEEARKKVATSIASEVNHYIRYIDKAKEGTDLGIENVTHGPNLEVFLKNTIKKDGKTGFDKLEEIGGAFKPGEEFSLNVEQYGDGSKKVSIGLRNNEYDLDLNKIHELSEEYRASKRE